MNLKRIVGLVVFALLVFLIGFFLLDTPKIQESPKDFVLSRDLGLTEVEKKVYLDEISKTQEQLDKLSESVSLEEKYKLNFHLGVQYYSLGEYSKAREYYEKAKVILPENSVVWGELFVVSNAMKDYESALEFIHKAIELNPTAVQYWRWLLELEEGPLALSIEDLDAIFLDSLKHTKQHTDILLLYAGFLENKKRDLQGAVERLKQVEEQDKNNASVYEAEIKRIQDKLK